MSFQTIYLPTVRGIARVQNAASGTGATNAASFTITFGQNLTAGNLVGVAICSQGPTAMTLSSIGTVAFEQASPAAADTTGTIYSHLFWGKVITGGNALITVSTIDASTKTFCGVACEYTGINISPDIVPTTAIGAPTTNLNISGVTNTQPNALYLSVLGQRFTSAAPNTAWLTSIASPFSIVQQISTNLNGTNQDRGVALIDAIVATTAQRNVTAISGFTNRFSGVVGVFAEIPAAVQTGAAW